MYGPNTNTSGGSIVFYLEIQAAYIRRRSSACATSGAAAIEVRRRLRSGEADGELQARFAGTAWTECDSWYRNEGGRIVTNWPGYMREYEAATAGSTRGLRADRASRRGGRGGARAGGRRTALAPETPKCTHPQRRRDPHQVGTRAGKGEEARARVPVTRRQAHLSHRGHRDLLTIQRAPAKVAGDLAGLIGSGARNGAGGANVALEKSSAYVN